MKRSEVLKVLDDALIETRYISYYPDRQKDLEFVLTALEKAGMTPPRYQAVYATGKRYNKETDFARDTFWAPAGWEDEDET